jgi:subtilisin family serine protease
MRCMRRLSYAALLVLAGVVACEGAPSTTEADPAALTAARGPSSRYVVTFKGAIPSGFAARVEAVGAKVALRDDAFGFAALSGLSDQAAARLVKDGLVATAEIERVVDLHPYGSRRPANLPSGSTQSQSNPAGALFFGALLQWNMTAVHADAAWAAGKLGSSSTAAAILDTGLDYTHPDLAGLVDLTRSVDLVGEADSVLKYAGPGRHPITDLHSHGSHGGAIVSSNALLTAGITSRTTLIGVKVCNMRGRCPVASVLEGIRYAVDVGASVINLSLGGSFFKSEGRGVNSIINSVMNYAQRKGVLIVVSAGNSAEDLDHDGDTFNTYCSAPHVICVSGLGPTGESAFGPYVNPDAFGFAYSNFGRSAITVAAPGGNVILDAQGAIADLTPVWSSCSTTALEFASLQPADDEAPTGLLCPPQFFPVIGFVGTSEAAPHVTGLAASLASQGVRSAEQVRAAIIRGADDLGQRGTDSFYGRGRINVAASLGVD